MLELTIFGGSNTALYIHRSPETIPGFATTKADGNSPRCPYKYLVSCHHSSSKLHDVDLGQ